MASVTVVVSGLFFEKSNGFWDWSGKIFFCENDIGHDQCQSSLVTDPFRPVSEVSSIE